MHAVSVALWAGAELESIVELIWWQTGWVRDQQFHCQDNQRPLLQMIYLRLHINVYSVNNSLSFYKL